jgi:hypothetical protein
MLWRRGGLCRGAGGVWAGGAARLAVSWPGHLLPPSILVDASLSPEECGRRPIDLAEGQGEGPLALDL